MPDDTLGRARVRPREEKQPARFARLTANSGRSHGSPGECIVDNSNGRIYRDICKPGSYAYESDQNMKIKSQPIVPLTLGLLAVTALSTAYAEQGKFYVAADAGAVVTVDTELKEFFGQPLLPNSQVSFDPGFRLGVRGGYGVTDWFDTEVETGFMANHIKSVTGASETDASLTNIPLLFNARFHCPSLHKVSPYFGGGFGCSTTILSADELVIGGTALDGSTAGIVFAYQAFAGVRVALNERMGLSLEYHYFATTSSTMSADVTVGTASDEVKLGGTASHAVTIAFDYHF